MSGSTSRSPVIRTWAFARTAAISCGGCLGTSAGLAHSLYGVVTVTMGLLTTIVILVLAVCLPDKRSERLYRWGRLLLGREEPASPQGA